MPNLNENLSNEIHGDNNNMNMYCHCKYNIRKIVIRDKCYILAK